MNSIVLIAWIPWRPAGHAYQTDNLVAQVWGLSLAQQDEPVQRVFERAADASVVKRAAPDHPVRRVDRVDEAGSLTRGMSSELGSYIGRLS